MATADQVMRRFEMQRSKAYQRLGVLVDAGFARHEPGVRTQRVYLATKAGLAAADLDLPRATVSAASFAHDTAVVDVAITLERSTSRTVLTEREIRRADARGADMYRLLCGFSRDDARRGAWPDLVVLDHARESMDAIEVELSLKKASRITDKLRAYRMSRYHRVQYVCGSKAIATAVVREASRAGVERKLEIRSLGDASAVATSSKSEERDELIALLRKVRAQAAAVARADAAEHRVVAEFEAGRRLVEQIASYLTADRATQRATREHWQLMVARWRQMG